MTRTGRSRLLQALLAAAVGALFGCSIGVGDGGGGGAGGKADDGDDVQLEDGAYDFIVVGSGAGGGPLAANLARQGKRVLLLEAGENVTDKLTYQVPAWHTMSTEDEDMRWDYYVKHYSDDAQAQRDTKLTPEEGGVLYPRAGTLGGCTSHNAMITVYPHASDWETVARVTKDPDFKPDQMRKYFEYVERNNYLGFLDDDTGHGFGGWLQTERADPTLALGDFQIKAIVAGAANAFGGNIFSGIGELAGIMTRDLNGAAWDRDTAQGLFAIPLATNGGHRNGTAEYILDTVRSTDNLTLKTRALVTGVIWDPESLVEGATPLATGVTFIDRPHQYQADPRAERGTEMPEVTPIHVKKGGEVILAAGAYNTPQLLQLSGVGPRDVLDRAGIPLVHESRGVGRNLQDRYEVGVVFEVDDDFRLLKDCSFGGPSDKCLVDWQTGGGPYTSNGGVVGIVKKSNFAALDPDLFVFGLAGNFKGYFPGYSKITVADKHHFTWAILKAHTGNKAGTVEITSSDPRVRPEINFHYFQEGQNGEADVNAVADGVDLVRNIAAKTRTLMPFGEFKEVWPGENVSTREQVNQFIKDEAWGHHASCTARMGELGDPDAVLDSHFRVQGVNNLRVVDASVFPEIPGFFIVVPIYMMSEKATDTILWDDFQETRRF